MSMDSLGSYTPGPGDGTGNFRPRAQWSDGALEITRLIQETAEPACSVLTILPERGGRSSELLQPFHEVEVREVPAAVVGVGLPVRRDHQVSDEDPGRVLGHDRLPWLAPAGHDLDPKDMERQLQGVPGVHEAAVLAPVPPDEVRLQQPRA